MKHEILHGKTVLIVDDEPMIRELLCDGFRAQGCRVMEAENGGVASEILKNERADLIISDVRMPGGDGFALLKAVRATSTTAPLFCLISGFSDALPETLYGVGADAIFPKPFRMRVITSEVARLFLTPEIRWGGGDDSVANGEGETIQVRKTLPSKAVAIGRGGIFLPGVEGCRVGDRVELDLLLTGGMPEAIRGTGVVRWVRLGGGSGAFSSGCGVEFLTVSPDCLPGLLKKIREMKPKAFIPEG